MEFPSHQKKRDEKYATSNGYLLQTLIAMLSLVNPAYSPTPSSGLWMKDFEGEELFQKRSADIL